MNQYRYDCGGQAIAHSIRHPARARFREVTRRIVPTSREKTMNKLIAALVAMIFASAVAAQTAAATR